MFSIPSISLHFPPFSDEPYNCFAKFLYKTSFISELFPEPETPVTQVNTPNGIFTSKFFKLFSFAPFIVILTGFAFLLDLGTAIFFLPLKYCPVIESVTSFISSAVPLSYYISSMHTCTWSNIYYHICCIHSIFVVFYHYYGIS